jgi:hypothetical protein
MLVFLLAVEGVVLIKKEVQKKFSDSGVYIPFEQRAVNCEGTRQRKGHGLDFKG